MHPTWHLTCVLPQNSVYRPSVGFRTYKNPSTNSTLGSTPTRSQALVRRRRCKAMRGLAVSSASSWSSLLVAFQRPGDTYSYRSANHRFREDGGRNHLAYATTGSGAQHRSSTRVAGLLELERPVWSRHCDICLDSGLVSGAHPAKVDSHGEETDAGHNSDDDHDGCLHADGRLNAAEIGEKAIEGGTR